MQFHFLRGPKSHSKHYEIWIRIQKNSKAKYKKEIRIPVISITMLGIECQKLKYTLHQLNTASLKECWPITVLKDICKYQIFHMCTCMDMGSPRAGLASYTVFIFIRPSRAAVSCATATIKPFQHCAGITFKPTVLF